MPGDRYGSVGGFRLSDDSESKALPKANRKAKRLDTKAVLDSLTQHSFAPWVLVEQRPCCLVVSVLTIVGAIMVAGFNDTSKIRLGTSTDALIEADGPALLHEQAFEQARLDRGRGRRLQANSKRFATEWSLYLTYVPNPGKTLVSPRTVRNIRDVEMQMKQLPTWAELCSATDPSVSWLCRHGASLVNFAFPHTASTTGEYETLYLNGTGSQEVPLGLAVEWAHQEGYSEYILPAELTRNSTAPRFKQESCADHEQVKNCAELQAQGQCEPFSVHERYMQELCPATCGVCDSRVDGVQVQALRSYFSFAGDDFPRSRWPKLMAEVVAALNGFNQNAGETGFSVFYNGQGVRSYEATIALESDMKLAIGSVVFAFAYLVLHTQNPLVVLLGLLLIALSLPCGLALLVLLSGSLTLNVTTCLVGFVLLGFGSHMILHFVAFWRLSAQREGVEPIKLGARLRWMYVQVSMCCLASSGVTVLIFMLNLTSELRPLRELGLLLGASIGMVTLLVFSIVPVALVFAERLQQPHAASMQKRASMHVERARSIRKTALQTKGRRRATKRMTDGGQAEPSKLMIVCEWISWKWLDAQSKTWADTLAFNLASFIARWPHLIVAGFVALTLTAVIMGFPDVKNDPRRPQVFQKGHNQFESEEFEGRFNAFDRSAFAAPLPPKRRCIDISGSGGREVCSVHGCRTFGRRLGSNASCPCMQQSVSDSVSDPTCAFYNVAVRVVGRQGFLPQKVTRDKVLALMRRQFGNYSRYKFTGASVETSNMHTAHWDSGREGIATLVTLPDVSVEVVGRGWGSKKACNLAEVCYCETELCDGTEDDLGLGNLELAETSPTWDIGEVLGGVGDEDGRRRLQAGGLAAGENVWQTLYSSFLLPQGRIRGDLQALVHIVLGVEVIGQHQLLGSSAKGQYYQFNKDFRFEDPWVQRVTLDLCYSFPKDLRISQLTCWPAGLMEWWQSRDRWPIRPEKFDVHQQVLDYIAWHPVQVVRASGSYKRGMAADYVWISPEGKLQGMFVEAAVDLSTSAETAEILELMTLWDSHSASYNSQVSAKTSAAWRAWHTCPLWVRAQASQVMMDAAKVRLLISLGCVLVGARIAVGSTWLAVVVTLTVTTSVTCTIWVMATLLRWRLGPVELLALTTFVGFTADYCLHVANKYHTCQFFISGNLASPNFFVSTPSMKMSSNQSSDSIDRLSVGSRDGYAGKRDSEPPAVGFMNSMMARMSSAAHAQDGAGGAEVPGRQACRRATACYDSANDNVNEPLGFQTAPAKAEWRRNNRPIERKERGIFAVQRMAASALGSAFVTLGCASFFIAAEFAILKKIGTTILVVSICAVLYTNLGLPAVLMLCGTTGHDFDSESKVRNVAHALAKQDRMVAMDSDFFDAIGDERRIIGIEPPLYYIMSMPTRGMGAASEGYPASRARMLATGG